MNNVDLPPFLCCCTRHWSGTPIPSCHGCPPYMLWLTPAHITINSSKSSKSAASWGLVRPARLRCLTPISLYGARTLATVPDTHKPLWGKDIARFCPHLMADLPFGARKP